MFMQKNWQAFSLLQLYIIFSLKKKIKCVPVSAHFYIYTLLFRHKDYNGSINFSVNEEIFTNFFL